MSEKKAGVIFSYISLLTSSILSILITPIMLSKLGDVEYGLYQTISSFVGVLTILDFGSGVATTKYVAEFNLKKDSEGCKNYLAMAVVINGIICAVIVAAGIFFVASINSVYGKSFTASQLLRAKVLAWMYILNIVLTIYANLCQGVIIGFGKFAFGNGIGFAKILIRYGMILFLLNCNFGSVAISLAVIIANIAFTIIAVWFAVRRLNVYPKLNKWDNKLFWGSLTFLVALFLQSIVSQINNSIDKVLLGSLVGGTAVAIYAVAMNIYMIYGSLSGAIKRVLLPDAVKLVSQNVDGKKITDFVIEGGRYQFLFLIYILCGFILVGKEFVYLWVGESYETAYYIAIILMTPTLFQLSQNITETILDAMGKRMVRSVILTVGAAANVIITIVLVKRYGAIGAPVGTAISCVASWLVALNIYHKRVMGLQVFRMFFEICHKIVPCALLSMAVALPVNMMNISDFCSLIIKGVIFSVVYLLLLWLFGLNLNEKRLIKGLLNKGRKIWIQR